MARIECQICKDDIVETDDLVCRKCYQKLHDDHEKLQGGIRNLTSMQYDHLEEYRSKVGKLEVSLGELIAENLELRKQLKSEV